MVFLRWIDWVNNFLKLLIGIALGIMTLLVFLQVIVRFVLPSIGIFISVPWTEELSRFLMIWLVFIGGAVATRYSKLLAVDVLVTTIPVLPGKIVKIIAHTLSLVFYVCIFKIGLNWAFYGLTETAPVMGFLMIYIYSAMAVGAGLMILNTIALFIDTWINNKDILESDGDYELKNSFD